jgi:hypothetical protein
MRSAFSFLSFFAYLCLSVFIFGCKQNSNSTSESPWKINHQVTIRNNNPLKVDSTIIDKLNARRAYDNQPKISIVFPSKDIISCKIAAFPYTTKDEKNQPYFDGQTYLNTIDSAYLVSQLKTIPQLIANPAGGTSFGNFDGLDTANRLMLDTDSRVGILCALKTDTNYMCHIMLSHKNWYNPNRGIMALITPHGKILEWMISDGEVTPGDPHGKILRMVTISSDNMINIEEYAEGDNSEHYEFYATYKVEHNDFAFRKRTLYALR